jgi:large subunit ribosomal protein L22
MEFRAEARFVRVSPQKARLVLDLIRGKRVEEALNTLAFTKKRVTGAAEKLLRSALDNATYLVQEKGLDVDVDNLIVKTAVANDGPRMKRIRPAPMGRAYRYQRRIAHLEIVLAERVRKGGDATTVTGEDKAEAKAPAKSKARAKKPVARKKAGAAR